MCSAGDPAYRADGRDGSGGVFMIWNAMLAEGLLRYGYRREAAELFQRMMQGPLAALRADGAFRECYNADAPEGLGERNHVTGVPSLSTFLRVLGVRLISPRKVGIEGSNPFPWPGAVRRGGGRPRGSGGAGRRPPPWAIGSEHPLATGFRRGGGRRGGPLGSRVGGRLADVGRGSRDRLRRHAAGWPSG